MCLLSHQKIASYPAKQVYQSLLNLEMSGKLIILQVILGKKSSRITRSYGMHLLLKINWRQYGDTNKKSLITLVTHKNQFSTLHQFSIKFLQHHHKLYHQYHSTNYKNFIATKSHTKKKRIFSFENQNVSKCYFFYN